MPIVESTHWLTRNFLLYCSFTIFPLAIGAGFSMADHEAPPIRVAPITIQLRLARLALMVVLFTVALLSVMVILAVRGHVLFSFPSTDDINDHIDHRDNLNWWSSAIFTALNVPASWALSSMLPVCFLALASTSRVQTKPKFVMTMAFIGIDIFVKYLINNSFQAVSVQFSPQSLKPSIDASDMKANTESLDIMSSYVPTAMETLGYQENTTFMINTVLRNVVAPIVLKNSTPVCLSSD